MIPVHVSVIGNQVLPLLFTGPLTSPLHDFIPPPPATGPPFTVSLENPVPVMWPPGFGMQQNKLTTTVVHKFQFIMLEGHDCGYLIPHVTIPPANLALPLIIAFSSRKVMFSASTVKANGAAVGCSQVFPPWPMMTCSNPISLPTSCPPTNLMNNVTVGMTGGDVLAGMAAIAISIFADILCIGKPDLASSIVGKVFGFSSVKEAVVKTLASIATGAAKILFTGEGTISIAVGSSYGGITFSYTRTAEGENKYGIQGQAGTGIVSGSASASHTSKPDGSSSNETSVTGAGPVAQGTHTSTTDRDRDGNEKQTTNKDVMTGGAAAPSIGPVEGGVAGTAQKTTVTEPGKAPETSQSSFGGAGASAPFVGGTGVPLWGDSL